MSNPRTTSETQKRYDLVTNYRAGSSIEEMERADDGEWIRYEDVASVLASAAEREQALREALTKIAEATMLAQSDPYASAQFYRAQLINACNHALAALRPDVPKEKP